MRLRLFTPILITLALLPTARAEDITVVTNVGGRTDYSGIGWMNPLNGPNRTTGCNVMKGVLIDYSRDRVTGIRPICGNFSKVAGTLAATTIGSRAGSASTFVARRECASGKVVSGLRFHTTAWLTTLTIACGEIQPDYTQSFTYSNDPEFDDGSGVAVRRVNSTKEGDVVGGFGGFYGAFDCPGNKPVLQTFKLSVNGNGEIDGIIPRCSEMAAPKLGIESPVGDNRPDLITRTALQKPVWKVGQQETLIIDTFNTGRGPVISLAGALYTDIIFSTLDLDVDPASFADDGCTQIAGGRIRCPRQSMDPGQRERIAIRVTPRRARPLAPIVAVQSSYEINDVNPGNNTYGFPVTVTN